MAVLCWMQTGMEVVDDMPVVQSQAGWSHVGRCLNTSRVRGDMLMTSDHAAILVHSYG